MWLYLMHLDACNFEFFLLFFCRIFCGLPLLSSRCLHFHGTCVFHNLHILFQAQKLFVSNLFRCFRNRLNLLPVCKLKGLFLIRGCFKNRNFRWLIYFPYSNGGIQRSFICIVVYSYCNNDGGCWV